MLFTTFQQSVKTLFIFTSVLFCNTAIAAVGDILFSDDFERAALAPNWTTDVGTAAGINNDTSNSITRSMFTRHEAVVVTSSVIDLSVTGTDLSYWVRRGQDSFSEDPDGNEDFVIEYLDSVGSWTNIATYAGNGTAGEIITDTIPLPVSALHANFQLRVRQTGGSGSDFDYWHIDDVILTETATTRPPLALGSCDDFEQGLSNWTITSSGGSAGINTATFQSSSSAMFTSSGTVTVTSDTIDTSSTQFDGVSVWIRRGADAFSEDPDTNEDLTVEYLNNVATWVTLETFTGAGTQGEIFIRDYSLPASAQHSSFQIRFTQQSGNAGTFDFWHIDDVCIEGTVPFPTFVVQKIVTLEDDPVNVSNPKAIPLSNSVYRIRVVNAGFGSPDNGTLLISDDIASGVELFTGNFSAGAPFAFTDGTDASGLTCNFASLSDATDCVTFLDSGSNPITPNGSYDSTVQTIEFRPSGTMNASSGSDTPFFDIEFRVRISSP